MKRLLSLLLTFAMICSLAACGSKDNGEMTEVTSSQLSEANQNSISVETHNVIMKTEREGTVSVTVQLPDYEKLYKDAYSSENPDKFFYDALISKSFDTSEYNITASVTIENNEEVIHIDEAIQAFN